MRLLVFPAILDFAEKPCQIVTIYMLGTHLGGNAALHLQVNIDQQYVDCSIAGVLITESCIAPEILAKNEYSFESTVFFSKNKMIYLKIIPLKGI